jgi:hypothetical protein
MDSMMVSPDYGMAGGLTAAVHGAAALVFLTGLVLFCVYAAKTFAPQRLLTWSLGLLAAGTVACLLLIGMSDGMGAGMRHGGSGQCGMMGKAGMMEMGMMDDAAKDGQHHADPMAMSMHDMAGMLEGKSGAAFDKAFLEAMIPHHEGAVAMAEAALESAGHDELKAMARDIIESQRREIRQMQGWLASW